jgi:hypothetical protein
MALTDNLMAFWELEETSGTRVDSHGNNDLTDNNTVTSNPGIVGTAAQFTLANTEYLSIADNTDLSTGDIDYTLQAWVRLDTKATLQVIAAKYGASGTEREYHLRYNQSTDRFYFAVNDTGGTAQPVESNNFGAPSTATWYCIHVWHDSVNNQVGIAVNAGTANTDAATGGSNNSSYAFQLGYSDQLGFALDGRLDQVGFWKRVLTSQERTELYNGGAGMTYAAMAGATVSWLPVTHVVQGPTNLYVAAGMTPPDKV